MATKDYARRTNPDETVDSICVRCFRTIATASRDGELDQAEHEHVCEPGVLKYCEDVWERARFERVRRCG